MPEVVDPAVVVFQRTRPGFERTRARDVARIEQVELELEFFRKTGGERRPLIPGYGGELRFHELECGYEPRIRDARLPGLQRGEPEVQQDGDQQQSTGEHHVGTDEQPAMAGL